MIWMSASCRLASLSILWKADLFLGVISQRYLAHSTQTLKCLVVIAATKQELLLEKVPLCNGLQADCVLESTSGEMLTGASAICRFLLVNSGDCETASPLLPPKDSQIGCSVQDWLEV